MTSAHHGFAIQCRFHISMNKNFELLPLLNLSIKGTSDGLLNFGYFFMALRTVW